MSVEKMRELVKKWRRLSELNSKKGERGSCVAKAFVVCADELEALLAAVPETPAPGPLSEDQVDNCLAIASDENESGDSKTFLRVLTEALNEKLATTRPDTPKVKAPRKKERLGTCRRGDFGDIPHEQTEMCFGWKPIPASTSGEKGEETR